MKGRAAPEISDRRHDPGVKFTRVAGVNFSCGSVARRDVMCKICVSSLKSACFTRAWSGASKSGT